MVAAFTFFCALGLTVTVSARAIAPQTPNPAQVLAKRIVHFPEGCDVVCNWEGDQPELPECTWDLCMNNVKGAKCNKTEVTSVNDHTDEERWNSVYSMFLYENLTINWRAATNKRLPFSAWYSDQLHGPENMKCHVLADHSGCNTYQKCDDVTMPAAGFFVLNSFVSIHNMLRNFYDGIDKAAFEISAEAQRISNSFSPNYSGGIGLDIMIDIIAMSYAVSSTGLLAGAAAPFWNALAKRLPWFRVRDIATGSWASRNANTHGTLKDFMNGMVTGSLTLAKDLTKAQAEIAVDKQMAEMVSGMIKALAATVDRIAQEIFSGEQTSTAWLYRMLQDGKFINDHDISMSTEEIKQILKKPIYTQMIPVAWRMSNLPVGPFILKTDVDCNDDGSLKNSRDENSVAVDKETREQNGICHDGKLYVLASAPEPGRWCSNTGDTSDSCWDPFKQLPGAGDLKGDKWGQVRMTELTRAGVNTWIANGRSNDFSKMDLDKAFADIDIMTTGTENPNLVDQILEHGNTAPGMVMLPVCDAYEATRGWEAGANTVGGPSFFKPWANYPCN